MRASPSCCERRADWSRFDRGGADPHDRDVRRLASARRSLSRPARAGRIDQRQGLHRPARQSHDLSVDRHVGAREGDSGRRDRRLGRDLRHRRTASGAGDPSRSADSVRRRPRRARCRVDLRRALRSATRPRRIGGYYGDALAAIDIALWDVAARQAGVPLCEAAGRCAHETHPGLCVGSAEGHAGRTGRACARHSRREAFAA